MATNKPSGTAGGQKKSTASREQLLTDVRRIRKNFPGDEISRDFYRQHGQYTESATKQYWSKIRNMVKEAGSASSEVEEVPIKDKVAFEREKLALKKDSTKKQLDEALHQINVLSDALDTITGLKERTPQIFDIAPKEASGHSESVAVICASDWHIEERVLPGDVGGLNQFNLEIGEKRCKKFWQGGQRLWGILRRDTSIKKIIVFLGGDFITNTIHEDAAESNLLMPADAIYHAQNQIISGLKFMLENTDAELHMVCHSGNHGRMTKKQRNTTETGNSLEQFMFYGLRDFFAAEPRCTWQIAEGYHSFVRLFDGQYVIRFHHGHGMNYGGGVGGIYVPVNKAINQWNKGNKVNLDVFGHFHTYIDAGNFVANGSLIGHNAYAIRIKADYEPPQQAFFLINRKYRAKTMATPIFVSE